MGRRALSMAAAGLLAVLSIAGCNPSPATSQPVASATPQTPPLTYFNHIESMPSGFTGTAQALTYAKTVKWSDVTSPDDVAAQLPKDVTMSLTINYYYQYKFTFSDGSAIIAMFLQQ